MKREKKKNTFSKIAIRLTGAVFFIYAVVSLVTMQIQISNKKNQLEQVQANIAQQQKTNDEYKALNNEENLREYVERIAREKFGYVYPDERIIYEIAGE